MRVDDRDCFRFVEEKGHLERLFSDTRLVATVTGTAPTVAALASNIPSVVIFGGCSRLRSSLKTLRSSDCYALFVPVLMLLLNLLDFY